MKPPTFFLSSTIYDFQDLRSAIKYFLEQQGCTVLSSDFNDFPKPIDLHSYEACLKSISLADFFVLLIGSRVGGWYDEVNQISITQKEYREAYRLHREGKLKLLNFVRADAWRMKDDRKLLANHLKELGYDHGATNQILLSPSKAASNADFISKFIEEVGRNLETAAAAKSHLPLPTGNWIHLFSTFKEVIETIQVQVFSGKQIEEVAVRRLLTEELRGILRRCLINPGDTKPKPISPDRAIDAFYSSLASPLSLKNKFTTVKTKEYSSLLSLWIHIMQTKFFPQILPEVVRSSAFMDYNSRSGTIEEQPVRSALTKLQTELVNFAAKDPLEIPKLLLTEFPAKDESQLTKVESLKLLILLHSMDRWSNIINLCKAIIRHLEGQPFMMPRLRPVSPMYAQGELEKEFATVEQLENYLAE